MQPQENAAGTSSSNQPQIPVDPKSITISSKVPETNPTEKAVSPRIDAKGWQSSGFAIVPLHPANLQPNVNINGWMRSENPCDALNYFQKHPECVVGALLPDKGVVAFSADGESAMSALSAFLEPVGVPSALTTQTVNSMLAFYRIAGWSTLQAIQDAMPPGVTMKVGGEIVALPSHADYLPDSYTLESLADLPTLTWSNFSHAYTLKPAGSIDAFDVCKSPLLPFSLRGKSAEFEKMAKETKPLLGDVCLSGHATVWWAQPSAGKTLLTIRLLIDAVREKRIDPGNVFYINADDNSSGLATKMAIADELGVHTIVPGFKKFKAENLVDILDECVSKNAALDTLVIVDTLKKFTDLMNKRHVSLFNNACRRFIIAGGTFLGLAHVNKRRGDDGKLIVSGTSDLLDDFDAGYVIDTLRDDAATGYKVVQFDCRKSRGHAGRSVAYAYANDQDISYGERLESVREVDADQLDALKREVIEQSDAVVIAAIAQSIGDGTNQKMALTKAVATLANVSTRAALKVIERYTGENPVQHRWTFAVKERGAQVYALLPTVDAEKGGTTDIAAS